MTEKDELKQLILDNPELCEPLLELLRLLRGQALPQASTLEEGV